MLVSPVETVGKAKDKGWETELGAKCVAEEKKGDGCRSEADHTFLLEVLHCENRIDLRVEVIMAADRRKYYGE